MFGSDLLKAFRKNSVETQQPVDVKKTIKQDETGVLSAFQSIGCEVSEDVDLLEEARNLIECEQYQSAAMVLREYLKYCSDDMHAFKRLMTLSLFLNDESGYVSVLSDLSECHPENKLFSEGVSKGLHHYPHNDAINQLKSTVSVGTYSPT
ncbi:MAG: hypothetical protein HOM11_10095 [Methylococcales bacterium]|jgi:hypothetical protein|nr:hypothetical protein [Methylococcales bacterium]MBT7443018.1 hypothetical protein [Methylococcales bacterium]